MSYCYFCGKQFTLFQTLLGGGHGTLPVLGSTPQAACDDCIRERRLMGQFAKANAGSLMDDEEK